MKIVLCSDSFIPVIDGVGRVTYEYAQRLSDRGNECYVVTPVQKTGFRGRYSFEIVDYLSVDTPLAPQYKSGIAIADTHYLERISGIVPDIIHAHSPGTAGAEALRLGEKYKVPVIGTFHSKYYDDLKRYTKSELISSIGVRIIVNFFERCDEVWTVSNYAAETLHEYGYVGDIKVMHNGSSLRDPDPGLEKRARQEFNLSDDPILLYAGQIDRKKNLGRIVEAAAVLRRRGRRFQLIFAGKGPDEDIIRNYAEQKGAGPVRFTGHISDTDLLDGLYMAASLFIFPSHYDTQGLVVSEAAGMGTPSVVVRNSAPAEFITNRRNGYVVIDQEDCIADAVDDYLLKLDDKGRSEMSLNARNEIPLGWDPIMDEVEKRYRSLISKGL